MDTVHTDPASRIILMCEALQSTREDGALTAFQRVFEERGLPDAIRTDNGLPFASPNREHFGNLRALLQNRLPRRCGRNGHFPS